MNNPTINVQNRGAIITETGLENNHWLELTTYENNSEKRDGRLYTTLMNIVDKYV